MGDAMRPHSTWRPLEVARVTRREAWLSAGLIFAVALVVRGVAASQIVFPKPEDTAYYVGVARNLVEGRGLVSDALWSFQTPPLVFPRPAFEVWLPLPTLLAAIPMALLGATFGAAQVSSVLVGALVPVLAWRLAADVAAERGLPLGRARTLALGTGLTSAAYLPLVLHSALPDSTMPFAALALAACLLMSRVARDARGLSVDDLRVIGLGVLIGLAALTRNEAIWLGLAWAIVAWGIPGERRAIRIRAVVVAGAIALIVFAPWMIRDWIVFGSPLPGQAAANALSVTGFDIFAWNDPPTIGGYLAAGPARLVEMRVEGVTHNLFNVLVLPGLPLSVIGLLALPFQARHRSLRPTLLVAALTFLVTSLAFPVATTWGTFLHAAGPAHVLLVIAALLGLDAGIARLGVYRGWTRPVAWLGATLGVGGSVLFSAVLLPSFGDGSRETADAVRGTEPTDGLDRGTPRSASGAGHHQLPDLAGRNPARLRPSRCPMKPQATWLISRETFGARLLIAVGAEHGHWPGVLDSGAEGADCFRPLDLGPGPPDGPDPLADVRVYLIACP